MFIPPAWAKDKRSSSYQPLRFNLDQLEQLLLGRNSSLEALHYQLESAFHQLDLSRYQGGLSVKLNYSHYSTNPLGEEYSIYLYEDWGGISLVYPIIDSLWHRRFARQEGEVMVEQQRALLEAAQLELLRELRCQYAALLKEKRLLNKYRRREKMFADWLAQAKQKYYYKESLLTEVLDIEALQLANQSLLGQHRQIHSLILARLASLAGLEKQEWEPVPPVTSFPPVPDRQYLLGLLDQHPLIRVYRLKASRDNIRLESSWYEHIRLDAETGVIVGQERDSDSAYKTGGHIGFRFSIPLFYKDLVDYKQLSLMDEQKRWAAEAEAQKQKLRQQVVTAYSRLEGVSAQQKLARKQINKAQEKIRFIRTQTEYSLAEPENSLQRLIAAYQQQWRVQDKLIELDYQWHTAYYDLLYLGGKKQFTGPAGEKAETRSTAYDSQPYLTPVALYIKNTKQLAAVKEQEFLVQFCQTKRINQILLNIRQIFASSSTPDWLPELISRLHQQGVSVWAMVVPAGAPAADGEQWSRFDPTPLLTYNKKHIISEAFDGLHLHLNFSERPLLTEEEFSQLVGYYGWLCQKLKAFPYSLKIGMSIPYWYDKLNAQVLADSIFYADELIVIPPEDLKINKLLDKLWDELHLETKQGGRVLLALDCNHFEREDQPRLEEYIEQVASQYPQQVGFAIFDYQTYQSIEER
jgi:outer membrane protein TolC